MNAIDKSVRLFLVDCTPGGPLTAEIMNWTGHVAAAPRSELAMLLKRPETTRTGIYILLGDDPASPGGVRAYIGEADDIGKRLYQHSRPEGQGGKDFWDRVIVLTSKDANLTKAHARYLESRLIGMTNQASRAMLENGTAPPVLPLPEADVSDMEYFIAQTAIVLPVIGVNVLRAAATVRNQRPDESDAPGDYPIVSPLFVMQVLREGIEARASEIDGEFTVVKGSRARLSWSSTHPSYAQLFDKLVLDGTLTLATNQRTNVPANFHMTRSSTHLRLLPPLSPVVQRMVESSGSSRTGVPTLIGRMKVSKHRWSRRNR